MTRITSAFAAALIASASFAGAALADGDYYDGAQKAASSASVDTAHTGSLDNVRADRRNGQIQFSNGADQAAKVNSGDYYDGAFRPN